MNEELDIYGFGTFFSASAQYQDIDILIIHQSAEQQSYQLAVLCKQTLKSKIVKADITMLTRHEEQQHAFITKSNALLIGKVYKASVEEDLHSIFEKISKINNFKGN